MAKIINREQFQKLSCLRIIKIGDIKYELGREVTLDDYFKFNNILFQNLTDEELNIVMSKDESKPLPLAKLMKVEEEKIKFIIEVLSRGCDDDDKPLIADNVMSNQKTAITEFDRITKNMTEEEYNKLLDKHSKKEDKKGADLKN